MATKRYTLISILLLLTSMAFAAEQWSLSFNGARRGEIGPSTQETTFNGTATITADASGEFSGTGNMSLEITATGPLGTCNASGRGDFQLTGRREGDYAYLEFVKGKIPFSGTCTSPVGTSAYDGNYDPSNLTLGGRMIERKAGATITHSLDAALPAGGAQVTGKITITITGGSGREANEIKGEFPADPHIWTLEVTGAGAMNCGGTSLAGRSSGSAEFPMPLGDGTARGEGPISSSAGGTGPAGANAWSFSGRMAVNGEIHNGLLTFTPSYITDKGQVGGPGISAQAGGRSFLGRSAAPLVIPVKNGAELIDKRVYVFVGCPLEVINVWKLKGDPYDSPAGTGGSPTEAWQIVFDGHDKWTKEIRPGVTGGANVHWQVDVVVLLANKQWKSGSAVLKVLDLELISEPAGVFMLKYDSDDFRVFDIQGSVADGKLTLRFPRDDSAKCDVQYQLAVLKRNLESTLQAAGVPNFAATATSLGEAGDIESTGVLLAPKQATYALNLIEGNQPGVGDEKITLKKLY